MLDQKAEVRKKLHAWGEANSVIFDASKEGAHVFCKGIPKGEGFRTLAVFFDGERTMEATVKEMVTEARCYRLSRTIK